MRVLVAAASRHGATAEIADAIGDELRRHGIEVDVVAPGDAGEIDGYDAIVLGSAVYAGHWLAPARDLAAVGGVVRRAAGVAVLERPGGRSRPKDGAPDERGST